LAVYRGHLERVPVVLGSATPSLESWHHAKTGRYRLLTMAERIGQGALPRIHVVDMKQQPAPTRGQEPPALSSGLRAALEDRLARGEQSLLFLNRRGFAPVLHCGVCPWKSACPHCSAWQVFHKRDRLLCCHHCGVSLRVPRACPDCGNPDILPVGRGTERLEEQLAALFPHARLGRIDADSTKAVGSLQTQLAAVHAGEVDILVGTQMVTKGHDFRRVTLVAAVDPDSALFAADFRAPERLFSILMQAAGRAGRDAAVADRSEMWIQTWNPQHPLFAALRRHDFAAFAASQLEERAMAGLPPFSHLALLRSEAKDPAVAVAFLEEARLLALGLAAQWGQRHGSDALRVYAPVSPPTAKIAGIERRQMLVEGDTRAALAFLLGLWMPQLHALRQHVKGLTRWAVDVDPHGI
jgi:primosomal protein N' (replication factor Y)